MDFHELQKTKVTDLRELAKEHAPGVTGVTVMKKDELVDMLADKMGIERPTKHVEAGLGKSAIKSEIRELKVKREAAKEAGDREMLTRYRKAIHRHKRKLRKMMHMS